MDPPLIGSYRPTSKLPLTAKILEKAAVISELLPWIGTAFLTTFSQVFVDLTESALRVSNDILMQSDDGDCSVSDLSFLSRSAGTGAGLAYQDLAWSGSLHTRLTDRFL